MVDPTHPLLWATDVGVGLCLLVAGVLCWRTSRSTAILVIAAGITWLLANVTADILFWHRALLVHALLALPNWRPGSRLAAVVVATTYCVCVLFPALLLDDRATIALAVAVSAAAAWNVREATGWTRHLRRRALWVASGLGGVLLASSLWRLSQGSDVAGPTLLTYQVAVAGAAFALAAGLRPPKLLELTDLVIDLGEGRSLGLRDALARAVRDPDLKLGYWDHVSGSYVDAEGAPVYAPVDASRAAVSIERDGDRLALLVMDASLARDPQVVESIEAAMRLSALNAHRQAEVAEQVRELEDSRRRLLVAADDERARLERELSAGLLCRLEDLLTGLRGLSGSPHLTRGMDQLERTAAELADVASGLRPADLDQGLDVALAALVGAAPVPAELRGRLGALPPEVELTVWYLCAEALSNTAKHAPQARVSIRLEQTPGYVRVSVEDDGPGGAVLAPGGGLVGLRDRVESLGGRLSLHRGGSGTRLVADLPLGDQS